MIIPLQPRLAVLGATVASAFMIPSTMSVPDLKEGDLDALNSLVFRPNIVSTYTTFLDCTGCRWLSSSRNEESVLSLEFTLSDDRHSLLFNSVPVYPIPLLSDSLNNLTQTQPIETRQRALSASHAEDRLSIIRSLNYSGSARVIGGTGGPSNKLIDFHFHISSLDNELVQLQILSVLVLEDEDGILNIVRVHAINERHHGAMGPNLNILPQPAVQSCGSGPLSLLCRLQSFVERKLSVSASASRRHGGCHGQVASMRHGVPFKGGPAKYAHYGEGRNTFRPPPTPQQHDPNTFSRRVHIFATTVLISVFVGIAAGLAATALGMILGTLMALFWIKFVKGSGSGNLRCHEVLRCDAASKEEQWLEGEGVADGKVWYTGVKVEERAIAEAPPGYIEKD